MTETIFEIPPDDKREISPLLRELKKLFQAAKKSTDQTEQFRLLRQFFEKLMAAVAPEGAHPKQADENLKKIILERHFGPDNYLAVGGGTDGQRIFFMSGVVVNAQEAEQLGRGAVVETQGNFSFLDSKDNKPMWMVYTKPGDGKGNSWTHGKQYWRRFMQVFGYDIVNLET